MPDAKENLSFEAVTTGLSEEARRVVSQLHAVALHNGCRFRVDRGDAEGRYALTYSGMSYAVNVDGSAITLSTEYDIRAFLHFYRNTSDPTARELLFHAAVPCEYCINDKCTTLVSGANRTITLWSEAEGICQEKKLCGPYRHFLRIGPVTPDNLESVRTIAEMAFRYCTPEMHADILRVNKVSYRTGEVPGATVIGYKHAVSCFGMQVEHFMRECLVEDGCGRTKMDLLFGLVGQDRGEQYIGVTTQYVNSACYQFFFGIACEPDAVPAALPEGVATFRIQPGEYAVYTSSAGDYRSVWQHFNDSFYPAEHKGYDLRRVFFEHYDRAGRLGDVCIPVSAEMPHGSGRFTRAIFTPDTKVAGVLSCNEKDHPLYQEVAGVRERLLRDFPHAERTVDGSIHSRPGWPMVDFIGVEVDQLDAVPEGLDIITIRGGWWNLVAHAYPRRGEFEIGAPAYRPRFQTSGLSHPRAFLRVPLHGQRRIQRGLHTDPVAGRAWGEAASGGTGGSAGLPRDRQRGGSARELRHGGRDQGLP